MSKRAPQFDRVEKDFYPTPLKAVEALIPFLYQTKFVEPCAGDGDLIRHVEKFGKKCAAWNDVGEDKTHKGFGVDATLLPQSFYSAQVITNPPWSRKLLEPLLKDWLNRSNYGTWLLLPLDYSANLWFSPYLDYCTDIVCIGRVKWIPDSPYTGKDNCAWYRFSTFEGRKTRFHGRRKSWAENVFPE